VVVALARLDSSVGMVIFLQTPFGFCRRDAGTYPDFFHRNSIRTLFSPGYMGVLVLQNNSADMHRMNELAAWLCPSVKERPEPDFAAPEQRVNSGRRGNPIVWKRRRYPSWREACRCTGLSLAKLKWKLERR
jgi:hypothetical protein